MRLPAPLLKAFLLLLTLQACAIKPIVPPESVQNGFLQHFELMAPAPDRSPFALNWHVNLEQLESLKQRYTRIYVAPVSTSFLEQRDQPLDTGAVESIRTFFRESFVRAIKGGTEGRYSIVDSPDGDTFVVEIAITKLVPTSSAVNILANVGGLFIPGALPVATASNMAASAAAHEIGKGRIGMALKVTDAASGTVIGEVYDERDDRAALILNIQDFTRWGNARMIVENWATEFVGLLMTPESRKISRPASIGLLLW